MEKLHTDIGKLALERGCITPQHLNECVELLNSEVGDRKIQDVLLSKGYVNQEMLELLQKRRKVNVKKIETQAIADYVLKMKMVPAERLKYCLDIQKRAQEQKTYIPIQQILISHGILSTKKVEYMLRAKEIKRFIRQAICEDDCKRSGGLIGRVLGGYEILTEIASGGMGTVFNALQMELDRRIALKILFDQFASKKKHLNQFYREARLSAMLNHPNLVHIFEVGSDQGYHYYSMELVEGINLGDRLRDEGKLEQEEALDLIIQAGQGLEHINSFNVVHLDIKPSNFIVRHDGILKIMDLGLASRISKIPPKASTMGTPYYMSPERIHNPTETNQRADIYALGVSFYRMITGEYPITGNDAKEILKNIREQIPIPITDLDPSLSSDISKVIEKMIAKNPEERYQNMTDVLNDLDRILL